MRASNQYFAELLSKYNVLTCISPANIIDESRFRVLSANVGKASLQIQLFLNMYAMAARGTMPSCEVGSSSFLIVGVDSFVMFGQRVLIVRSLRNRENFEYCGKTPIVQALKSVHGGINKKPTASARNNDLSVIDGVAFPSSHRH